MRPWNLPAVSVGIAAAAATALLAACGTSSGSPSDGKATEVRLGYFPNITHATALIGVEEGLFGKHLGPDITLKTTTFNAGPSAIEAIFSGAIDATYVGPNPAINGWAQSKGKAMNVIAGAASGGAFLVVKPQINGVEDLKGKKVGTPQLGNTQDVALRYWLAEHGLEADTKGGGEVSVVPQENSQNLQTFITGDIDGAWLPEPWASRFIQEGGGKVLVDERDLWPDGQFVVTHLIVRQEFAKQHPDAVKKLLEAHVEANALIAADPDGAAQTVNAAVEKLTGKALAQELLHSAFKNITFTNDPVASSLVGSADHATKVGLLDPVDLDGIYDLTALNEVLEAKGQPEVSAQ